MKVWNKFHDGVMYVFRNGILKIRYKFADGTITEETPGAELQAAYMELIRAELSNNAKQWYYRHDLPFDVMNDEDEELEAFGANPEEICVTHEETLSHKKKLAAVLKKLTPQQSALVEMLRDGVSVTKIAARLNISKAAVSQMRNRIQEKIKKCFALNADAFFCATTDRNNDEFC